MSVPRGKCVALAVIGLALFLSIFAKPLDAQTCRIPDTPSIIFVPPGRVGVGQTYAIVWTQISNLDAGGVYVVERSTTAAFSSVLDSQQTTSTSASFVAVTEGTYYHRVRAIPGCDSSQATAYSPVQTVNVVAALSNVVFSVQPAPTIVAVGDSAATQTASFAIENITKATVTVAVPSAPIGSANFFQVHDPTGELESSGMVTLSPRQPRRLEIDFLNIATSTPATYQGFIFLAGQPDSLAVTPYAFLNLKIGASNAATPVFRFKGLPAEYAFFPGYSSSQPDSQRPPITVQVENPGDNTMDIGAEIGPEVWLVPKSGWNASSIPPKQRIDVELSVDRSRAPRGSAALNGSALPRYTYFTVRSKNGQSARLLVQDNDAPAQATGRTPLDPLVRSYVVPQIVSINTASGHQSSRVRLSNGGGAAVNADLYFTPAGVDGMDPVRVQRATILVPPNDIVTLTDPLAEVFGFTSPAVGQLEVRAAQDKISFLTVTSDISVPITSGGSFGYGVPVAQRGEGARSRVVHSMAGVTSTAGVLSSVVLAETSGIDAAAGHLALYDSASRPIGSVPFSLTRNGEQQFDDILAATGGATLSGSGRVDIVVESGSGTVIGNLILIDSQRLSAAVIISRPTSSNSAQKSSQSLWRRASAAGTSMTYIIPAASNGSPSAAPSVTLSTVVGLSAPTEGPVIFSFSYFDAFGFTSFARPTITVPAGNTIEVSNVLENLFGLAGGSSAQGTIMIDVSKTAPIYARLVGIGGGTTPAIFGALPVIPSTSEAVISALPGMQRPAMIDGLEQSIDSTRGNRWDLLISEIAGQPASVTVRLFEAGNRTSPIAEQTFALSAHQQKRLATVFAALGLTSADRLKDRTNVAAVVTPESGSGVIVVSAIETDSRTGDITTYLLTPNGGVPATGVSKVTPVIPPPRHRGVRH